MKKSEFDAKVYDVLWICPHDLDESIKDWSGTDKCDFKKCIECFAKAREQCDTDV